MTVQFVFDTDDFLADWIGLEVSIGQAAYGGLREATNEAAEATTQHGYKNRTGTLTTSRVVHANRTGSMQWASTITWYAGYAKFVDEATKAHAIVAKKAKMLRFYDKGGNVVFRRRVWHPGTKGAGFSNMAAMHLAFDAPEQIQQSVDAAITSHP
jgi:hypothetical protein